jgi:hypothetical protein
MMEFNDAPIIPAGSIVVEDDNTSLALPVAGPSASTTARTSSSIHSSLFQHTNMMKLSFTNDLSVEDPWQ